MATIESSTSTPTSLRDEEVEKEEDSDKFTPIEPLGILFRKCLLSAYQQMPLPPSDIPRKYLVLNQIHGGFGDIAAAATAIKLILRIDPSAIIHWSTEWPEKANDLLPKDLLKNVNIFGYCKTGFKPKEPLDAVIYCPLAGLNASDLPYFRKKASLADNATMLFFQEIGSTDRTSECYVSPPKLRELGYNLYTYCQKEKVYKLELYDKKNNKRLDYPTSEPSLQQKIVATFVQQITQSPALASVPMNLDTSSGVFIDKSKVTREEDVKEKDEDRVSIQSRTLETLEDPSLKKQMLAECRDFKEFCSKYSLAFGYAHHTYAKERLIDFYVMQEKSKNIAVVLYQNYKGKEKGEEKTTLAYFQKRVFTEDRLAMLKQQGFKRVIIKSADSDDAEIPIKGSAASGLILLVVLREKFSKETMTIFQQVSNAQLTTGDNSACEVFSYADRRCLDFYMYEDVSTGRDKTEFRNFSGSKGKFLDQQIDLATAIYPALGELLTITSKTVDISKEQMARAVEILADAAIPTKLNHFMDKIRNEFDFHPILEGMLKRHIWHNYNSKMAEAEEMLLASSPTVLKVIETYFFLEPGKNLLSEIEGDITKYLVKHLGEKV